MSSSQRAGLSAFALKMVMVVLMLGDHLAYFLPHIFPFELRFAGRLVAPTFAFLMSVSLLQTRDRGQYMARLAGAGVLMLLGSMALVRLLGGPPIFNTIFLSLALSAMLVDKIERIATRKGSLVFSLLVICALLFAIPHVEGSVLLPVMVIIFYFLRGHRLLMCIAFIAATLLLWLLGGMVLHYQQLQVFALIPIMLYNGQRGGEHTGALGSKWFFYIFYPVHVWLLYVVRHFIFFA